ncbi:hypothetical protein DL96DRAFT_1588202 [Flagelloscypha sp. PMI_526]|nr:hypothetical protein DL96DRAFT_1588202 [Flagelloscypha sp. PMI_526]
MARFTFITALAVAVFALSSAAAPVIRADSAACDAARQAIVSDMIASHKAIKGITDMDAKHAAQKQLNGAFQGVSTIIGNIKAGEAPSADARTQVEDGLKGAVAAIQDLDATADPAVSDALTSLNASLADGSDVIANC